MNYNEKMLVEASKLYTKIIDCADDQNKIIELIEDIENEFIKYKLYEMLGNEYSPEIIEKIKLTTKQENNRNKAKQKLELLLSSALDQIKLGQLNGSLKTLNDIEDIKNQLGDNRRILSFKEFLLRKYDMDSRRLPGLLGYPLGKFRQLAKNIDGVQPGFYLISALTNIGKTAFLCSLALDMIETNPGVKVLYFSLDDGREVITNRLVANITQRSINSIQKSKFIKENPEINEAYKHLYNSNLEVFDIEEIPNIIEFETKIRLAYKENQELVIFLDGLYNLDTLDKVFSAREANIIRANKIKKIVDSYNIPIIMTGELVKNINGRPTLQNVMESGKYIYNANLVLFLHSPEQEINDKIQPILNLELIYAKNKLGSFKGINKLIFDKSCSIMYEKSIHENNKINGNDNNGGQSWVEKNMNM
jgi:hypothetical protein